MIFVKTHFICMKNFAFLLTQYILKLLEDQLLGKISERLGAASHITRRYL